MPNIFNERIARLQEKMAEDKIDFVLLTDPDSIYYVSGFCGDLGMDFGRPMIVAISRSGSGTIITPELEALMVKPMVSIEDIRQWMDGVDGEWRKHLKDVLGSHQKLNIGIEWFDIPRLVSEWLLNELSGATYIDITYILGKMRIIKSPEEIAVARQAGQVAIAMADAAARTIAEGVPEYEVALAVIAGGTRKAAEFLSEAGLDLFFSPTIHNLQVINTGTDTCLCHRRNSVRRLHKGDPVYLCFCTISEFKKFKLGFDREWFVETVKDEHARTYEICLKAQKTGLDMIRPGVIAQDVHKAVNEVYRAAGFEAGYRSGRGIGYSFCEDPELKQGIKIPLEEGMTLCLDGGITIPGEFGARVGDSFVVTKTGHEILTPYPKDLDSLII
ncbi:MAG: aminopeptidase P family protein [Deltaproteobacteria bacterium]|nr:MAG: aminopeptidase P family protein [Deltaproteobacteria bacterium]